MRLLTGYCPIRYGKLPHSLNRSGGFLDKSEFSAGHYLDGCNSNKITAYYSRLPGGGELLWTGTPASRTDGSLIRLHSPAPAGAIFAGWDSRTTSVGLHVAGAHHAKGYPTKLSTGLITGYSTKYVIDFGSVDTMGVDWTYGTTSQGASGSGLFTTQDDGSLYLRGVLSGAPISNSICPPQQAYYSKFSDIFPHIRYWLYDRNEQFKLVDAKYHYSVNVTPDGTGELSYQGWNGACGMTMMVLDVENGSVSVGLDQGGTTTTYPDVIQTNDPMFAYSLYNDGAQGFSLRSASGRSSKATAFYYCFDSDTAQQFKLNDARYYYGVDVTPQGSGLLSYQGWNGACDMTMMVLDVEDGAVNIGLEQEGYYSLNPDAILKDHSMFSYALYNPGSQGFQLKSAIGGNSKATAFYYCFTGTGVK